MKNKYFRSIATIVSAVILAGALAGCGASKDDAEGSLDTIKPEKYVTIGEYKGLTLSKEPLEVSDEEVESRIQTALDSKKEKKEITDRPAQMGDVVNIDYEGKENGVPFEGGTGNYDLELGSGSFIEGFEDGVVGMNVGDHKVLDLTFPEQYHDAKMAGKAVTFDVTVNSISEQNTPELTDEIASELDPSCSTAAEYREKVKKDLEAEKQTTGKAEQQADLLSQAVDNSQCDLEALPQWLISQNAVEYKTSTEAYISQFGADLDTYLTQMGTTREEYENQALEYGKKMAKTQLVVMVIAQKEGLSVTEQEVDDYLAEYAASYNTDLETVKAAVPRDELKTYILRQKVMDLMYDAAVSE